MTLDQWIKMTGIIPTSPTTEIEARSLCIDINHPNRADLWRLDDYTVSSVTGPVIWLIPRKSHLAKDPPRNVLLWRLAPDGNGLLESSERFDIRRPEDNPPDEAIQLHDANRCHIDTFRTIFDAMKAAEHRRLNS